MMEELINKLKNSDLKLIEKETGIPYHRMFKWVKEKSKPKSDDFNTLTKYFEDRKSSIEVVRPSGQIISNGNNNKRRGSSLIPFYNADFMAGVGVENYEDGTIYPEYYMDVPEFAGCIAFRAYSDSMEKIIRSGSILFGRKIEDWLDHLEYGQIYGITLHDTRRYLKRIRRFREDHKNRFLLTSENEIYDDFDVPKSKIKNIWLIDGWIIKTT